jgi:glycosyltransferase involved in cell wall biosynthesis
MILILTSNPFPIGLAATNRILSYCKGFAANGCVPMVVCIRATETNKRIFNTEVKGSFQGIDFIYPGNRTVRSKSFLSRRLNDFIGIVKSLYFVISALNKKTMSAGIYYGNNLIFELLSVIIFRLYGIRYFKEESENPEVYFVNRKDLLSHLSKFIMINILYKLYSGVLVMTPQLMEYFIAKGHHKQKLLLVPHTIEMDRFSIQREQTTRFNWEGKDYMAFMGSLSESKDGVLTLLETFALIKIKYEELSLNIAGDGSDHEVKLLQKTIERLNLRNSANLLGRVPSDAIPQFLCGAKVLVSCRPESLQSEYGFPTKVLEFLASGVPTVTTATGELKNYLIDGVNCFIAAKAEPKVIAEKVFEVFDDYDKALCTAQLGVNLVKEKFNHVENTKKFLTFIGKEIL